MLSQIFYCCCCIVWQWMLGFAEGYREVWPAAKPHHAHFHKPRHAITDLHPQITALSPSPTLNEHGTYGVMYSLGYHGMFEDHRKGYGVFRRGVFANEPPSNSCTQCYNDGRPIPNNGSTTSSGPLTCSTTFYEGVFRSSVTGLSTGPVTGLCLATNYTGPFTSMPAPSNTVPCCYQIPGDCYPTDPGTMNMTYSGVFRSLTTFASNITTSSTTSASPASSTSTPSVSSTSSISSNSPLPSSTSKLSSVSSSTTTILVISSSTITITIAPSSSTSSTAFTSFQNISTLRAPNVAGCGIATGSGLINGTGTVLVLGFFPVASIGTVSGSGTVTGCGTVSGTGVFTGSGVAIGCGTATGSGTVIGSGTVYIGPGNIIPVANSGTVSGSAVVVGCGTIIGSGAFTGTGVSPYSIVNTSMSSTSSSSTSTQTPPFIVSSISTENSAQGLGTVTGYGTIIGSGVATGIGARVAANTFTGSGAATGSGTAIGYGVASGYGTVIGSGYANGTGTFYGSASAIGSGTLIGSGTILVDGDIPLVTSGTWTGSGTVIGTGTIYGIGRYWGSGTFIGSPGTFTGTGMASTMGVGISIPVTSPTAQAGTTVTVFYDDCVATVLPEFVMNATLPDEYAPQNSSLMANSTSVNTGNSTNSTVPKLAREDTWCSVCENDAGICCPAYADCGDDGHCPWDALGEVGYLKFNKNIVAIQNSSTALGTS